MTLAAFVAGATALGVSWLAVGLLVKVARRLSLMDVPNARSSHSVPTPRGGGAGILGGTVVGLAVFAFMRQTGFDMPTLGLLGCTLAIGGLGLVDDRRPLPAGLRLLFHLAISGLFVGVTGALASIPLPGLLDRPLGPTWLAALLTVVWLAGVTNFFNFMDGVDGLAGGQAVASCIGISLAGFSGDATIVACSLAGACLGFLWHNWPPARIFMGDVGSGALGFAIAGLPLLAPAPKRASAVLAVAIGLALFVLDPTLTLVRRVLAGKPLMQSHREHLYQILMPAGGPSARTTSILLVAATVLSLAGAAAYRKPSLGWAAVTAAVAMFGAEYLVSRTRAGSTRPAVRSTVAGEHSMKEDDGR